MSNTLKYNGKIVISNGTLGNVKEYDENVSFNLIDKYTDYPTKMIFYNTENIFVVLPPISDGTNGFVHGNQIKFHNLGTGSVTIKDANNSDLLVLLPNTTYSFLATKNLTWDIDNVFTKSHYLNNCMMPDLTTIDDKEVLIGDGSSIVKKILDINDLNNFDLTNMNSGHIIVWDGTKWINDTLANVAEQSSTLDDIQNVTINSASSGDLLVYDGEEWVNQHITHALNDLTDITVSMPSSDEILVYNGSAWVNSERYFPLSSLSDVNVSPAENEVLQWKGTEWGTCYPEFNKMADVEVNPVEHDLLTYDGAKWVNTKSINVNSVDTETINISGTSLDLSSKTINLDGSNVNLDEANLTLGFNKLSEVNVGTPANGHVLSWNGSNWTNSVHAHNITGLTDTNINNIKYGEVMFWNGTKWINHDLRIQELRAVSISNPTSGQLLVFNGTTWDNANYYFSFEQLTNTDINDPQVGQHIIWNGSNWINASVEHYLRDMMDVNINSPQAGQVLRWNGELWTGYTLPDTLNNLSDTSLNNVNVGQYLSWNGSDWVNTSFNLGSSDISLDLNNLNDVNFVGLTIGQSLKWNGSNWTNMDNPNIGELSDVQITNPQLNQALVYDGTKWANSGHGTSVSGLTDTVISDVKHSENLIYDANINKWVNSPDFIINARNNNYYVYYDEMDKSYTYIDRLSYVYRVAHKTSDQDDHYGIYRLYSSNIPSGFIDRHIATSASSDMIVIMTTVKINMYPNCRFALGSWYVPTYPSSNYKIQPLANENELRKITHSEENWYLWTERRADKSFSNFYLSHIHNSNTTIDTGIAPTNDTWYDFKIIINPNTNLIKVHINDVYRGSITVKKNFTEFCMTGIGLDNTSIYELLFDRYLYVHKRKESLCSTNFRISIDDFE